PVGEKVLEASLTAGLGSRHPLEAVALAAGGNAVWGATHGKIDPSGKEFTIDFQPWTNGTYALVIEDAEGLGRVYEFDARIFPDPPPQVVFERPSDSQSVVPGAEL